MTDIILESNRASNILSSMVSTSVQDLSSEIYPSYPILAKDVRQMTAESGGSIAAPINGQQGHFRLNKSNRVFDMAFRITFTTTTTTLPVTYSPGLHFLEQYEIKSSGKTLLSMTDADNMARLACLPDNRRIETYRRALTLQAGTDRYNPTSTAASATYVPIFCGWFDSVQNNFDSYFYETVTVHFKFNDAHRAGLNGIVTTIADISLFVWSWRPDEKYQAMLRAKNSNPQRTLNTLFWGSFTNRTPCSSTTSTTVNINNNYAAFKTVVQVLPVVAAGVGLGAEISTVNVVLGGQTYMNAMPYGALKQENAHVGSAISLVGSGTGFALAYDNASAVVIDWGLTPDNWTSIGGAISFANINAPQITVTYPTLTAASYEVVITHFYWNILSFDNSNGSLFLSVQH